MIEWREDDGTALAHTSDYLFFSQRILIKQVLDIVKVIIDTVNCKNKDII